MHKTFFNIVEVSRTNVLALSDKYFFEKKALFVYLSKTQFSSGCRILSALWNEISIFQKIVISIDCNFVGRACNFQRVHSHEILRHSEEVFWHCKTKRFWLYSWYTPFWYTDRTSKTPFFNDTGGFPLLSFRHCQTNIFWQKKFSGIFILIPNLASAYWRFSSLWDGLFSFKVCYIHREWDHVRQAYKFQKSKGTHLTSIFDSVKQIVFEKKTLYPILWYVDSSFKNASYSQQY